jgi:hypothetical protein
VVAIADIEVGDRNSVTVICVNLIAAEFRPTRSERMAVIARRLRPR